jgi:hypothetical protein
MLSFKQYLFESVEDQLNALKAFEKKIKTLSPALIPDPTSLINPNELKLGFQPNFYNDKVTVFYEPELKGFNNDLGSYSPGNKVAYIGSSNSLSNLRHEIGGHAYQDLRQIEQGKKTPSETKIKFRSPNISSTAGRGNVGNDNPNYVLDDQEINARAITNARKAQDWYETALAKGMQDIDANDTNAVQNLKNTLRSKALSLGLKDEVTTWGKNNLTFDKKDTRKVENLSNKAIETTKEKIARGLAQVENELSSHQMQGLHTDKTKLPVDAAKEQQGFSGKDVSTAPRGKQVLGKLTQPLPGSNSPALSTAAKVGAGVVGALAGEYVVKPAAEKVGFFKAIESGTRAALSNSPNWVAKVADPALGAARFALDPLGTYSEFLEKQARMSLPTTKAERDKATERFERKDY